MKVFKIVGNGVENKNKKYPETIPFIVKDKYDDLFMVVKDESGDEFKYVNLQDGTIQDCSYDSLSGLMEENKTDVVLQTELKVVGEWVEEE